MLMLEDGMMDTDVRHGGLVRGASRLTLLWRSLISCKDRDLKKVGEVKRVGV